MSVYQLFRVLLANGFMAEQAWALARSRETVFLVPVGRI